MLSSLTIIFNFASILRFSSQFGNKYFIVIKNKIDNILYRFTGAVCLRLTRALWLLMPKRTKKTFFGGVSPIRREFVYLITAEFNMSIISIYLLMKIDFSYFWSNSTIPRFVFKSIAFVSLQLLISMFNISRTFIDSIFSRLC